MSWKIMALVLGLVELVRLCLWLSERGWKRELREVLERREQGLVEREKHWIVQSAMKGLRDAKLWTDTVYSVSHAASCPTNAPGFVPVDGVTRCNCGFGRRLKEALMDAPNMNLPRESAKEG